MCSSSSGTQISTCSAACRTSDRLCTRRANCSGAELLGVRWRTSGEDFPPEGRSKRKRLLRWGLKKGVGHPAAVAAAGRPGCSAPATLAPAAGRFPRTIPRKLAGKCLSVDAQEAAPHAFGSGRQPRRPWRMWRRSTASPGVSGRRAHRRRGRDAGGAGHGRAPADPLHLALVHGERHRPLDTVLQLANVAGPAVGNTAMSVPISARIVSAVRRWTPRIVIRRSTCGAKGRSCSSMWALTAAIASSR